MITLRKFFQSKYHRPEIYQSEFNELMTTVFNNVSDAATAQ